MGLRQIDKLVNLGRQINDFDKTVTYLICRPLYELRQNNYQHIVFPLQPCMTLFYDQSHSDAK